MQITLENKRVVFSVLIPREGYIDVKADTNEDAIELVKKLIGDNYKDLNVVQVYDVPMDVDSEQATSEDKVH